MEILDLEEFRREVLKLGMSRNHRITNSIGSRKLYRKAQKTLPFEISETEYILLIKDIHAKIKETLLEGKTVKLPKGFGELSIRKKPSYVKLSKGKIHTNLPIDWDTTLKLWKDNKEKKDNKTLIRHTCQDIYKIHHNKKPATFRKQRYYEFFPTRAFKVAVKEKANNYNLECLAL